MNRKSLVRKSTEKLSAERSSEEVLTSENLTNSLNQLKEDHPNKPITLIDRLISKEMGLCAERLGLDHEELQVWITLLADAPTKCILHALRTARQYGLDLLQEEVLLTKYDESWQVSISVDGWIKIINGHPAFVGLTFTQSTEEIEGVPLWIECTIHRSDRVIPTTVREYLIEVRNDSEVWKKMPRRMLRHRVFQQCARFALGIAPPQLQHRNESSMKKKSTPEKMQPCMEIISSVRPQKRLSGVDDLKLRLMI